MHVLLANLILMQFIIALRGCQPMQDLAVAPAAADVEALLDRLEHSADDLRNFRAKVRYDKWEAFLESRQIRGGELVYEVDECDGSKRFAITFTQLVVDDARLEQRKEYIFDGGWFVEKDHQQKLFIKRQIVAPGEEFDPLKLGEGPFPLPIGQPKEEVLARFDVKLLDTPSDAVLASLFERAKVEAEGLELTPKPGTPEAEDFHRVELFYDSTTLLPVGIVIFDAEAFDLDDPDGRDRTMAFMFDHQRNQGVDAAVIDITTPKADAGWQIDVRPWQAQ